MKNLSEETIIRLATLVVIMVVAVAGIFSSINDGNNPRDKSMMSKGYYWDSREREYKKIIIEEGKDGRKETTPTGR